MHAAGRLAILVVSAGIVVSCRSLPGLKKKQDEQTEAAPAEAAAAPMTLPVGSVHLVDPSGGFVLIRSSRGLALEPGTTLDLLGDGGDPVGQVRVSPARKGPFLTADIVSGTPRVGQRVTLEYRRGRFPPGEPPAEDDPNAIQVLE